MSPRSSSVLGGFFLTALIACSSACSSGTSTREGFVDNGTGAGQPGGGDGTQPPGASSGNPAPQPTKTGCAQGDYTEALPTTASLSDLTYSSTQAQAYVLSALKRRYPLGEFILDGGLTSPLAQSQGNCVTRFLRDKSTAQAVLKQAPTLVHECGHFFDLGAAKNGDAAFVLRDDLKFACKGGDTTSRGGLTFARSRLKTDGYYTSRKACGGTVKAGCDFYADIYLDGNPDDAAFESGDQGFNSVLEEATQYVNSLATALAFQEVYQGSRSSERDGILTFLWYIERYLQMARTDYAGAYEAISTDPCWRQSILSVWDRAWFFLEATKGMSSLGLDDGAVEELVKDPGLTAEIDALRKLECN
jgi:hypothetical protein